MKPQNTNPNRCRPSSSSDVDNSRDPKQRKLEQGDSSQVVPSYDRNVVDDVPDEIIQHIFSYALSTDLPMFSKLSPRFNKLVKSFMERVLRQNYKGSFFEAFESNVVYENICSLNVVYYQYVLSKLLYGSTDCCYGYFKKSFEYEMNYLINSWMEGGFGFRLGKSGLYILCMTDVMDNDYELYLDPNDISDIFVLSKFCECYFNSQQKEKDLKYVYHQGSPEAIRHKRLMEFIETHKLDKNLTKSSLWRELDLWCANNFTFHIRSKLDGRRGFIFELGNNQERFFELDKGPIEKLDDLCEFIKRYFLSYTFVKDCKIDFKICSTLIQFFVNEKINENFPHIISDIVFHLYQQSLKCVDGIDEEQGVPTLASFIEILNLFVQHKLINEEEALGLKDFALKKLGDDFPIQIRLLCIELLNNLISCYSLNLNDPEVEYAKKFVFSISKGFHLVRQESLYALLRECLKLLRQINISIPRELDEGIIQHLKDRAMWMVKYDTVSGVVPHEEHLFLLNRLISAEAIELSAEEIQVVREVMPKRLIDESTLPRNYWILLKKLFNESDRTSLFHQIPISILKNLDNENVVDLKDCAIGMLKENVLTGNIQYAEPFWLLDKLVTGQLAKLSAEEARPIRGAIFLLFNRNNQFFVEKFEILGRLFYAALLADESDSSHEDFQLLKSGMISIIEFYNTSEGSSEVIAKQVDFVRQVVHQVMMSSNLNQFSFTEEDGSCFKKFILMKIKEKGDFELKLLFIFRSVYFEHRLFAMDGNELQGVKNFIIEFFNKTTDFFRKDIALLTLSLMLKVQESEGIISPEEIISLGTKEIFQTAYNQFLKTKVWKRIQQMIDYYKLFLNHADVEIRELINKIIQILESHLVKINSNMD